MCIRDSHHHHHHHHHHHPAVPSFFFPSAVNPAGNRRKHAEGGIPRQRRINWGASRKRAEGPWRLEGALMHLGLPPPPPPSPPPPPPP
eukprot:1619112-Pyramimonas_sp.AAC.1